MRQVDADALIDVVRKWYFDHDVQSMSGDPWVVDDMIDMVIRTIRNAPTVDPEGHGVWMWTGFDEIYTCPSCEKSEDLECREYKWCPNCGLKMLGKDR